MDKELDRHYLLQNGWTEIPHGQYGNGHWNNKSNDFPRGGLDLKYAIEKQKQFDIINQNGAFYFYISDRHGYGYRIRKYVDLKGKIKNSPYTSLTKEKAKSFVEALNNGSLPNFDPTFDKKTFNLLLILKEKHGNRYFYVPTFEHLCKAALKVVLERNEQGYWYDFSEELDEDEKPEISKEDLEKMKDGPIKMVGLKEWEHYESKLDHKPKLIKGKKLLDKVIEDNDLLSALQFLEDRRDYEYEGFEIESLETID